MFVVYAQNFVYIVAVVVIKKQMNKFKWIMQIKANDECMLVMIDEIEDKNNKRLNFLGCLVNV